MLNRLFHILSKRKFYFHYLFWTCAITAGVMGSSIDEAYYRKMGLQYLQTHDFSVGIDHPPFFMWFGSLVPYLVAPDFTQLFRLSNILVFLFVLWLGEKRLRAQYGNEVSLIFLALFTFSPNFKAHAAIHGNDFLPAILISLTVILALTESRQFKSVAGLTFSYTLAVLSKISSGFLAPFLLIQIMKEKELRNAKTFFNIIVGVLVGAVCGLLLTYHFQLGEIPNFIESIKFQLSHNKAGHEQYFWGQTRSEGVWYYYILLFLLKLPLTHLLAIFAALYFLLSKCMWNKVSWLTFAPAFLLCVLLSNLNVQLGFRYYLPGLGLLYIGAAIVLGQSIDLKKTIKLGQLRMPLVISVIFVAAVIDVSTLLFGSYISYFNFLAPQPTRNFSDSNIDWGAGLPEHLKGMTIVYKNLDNPTKFFKSDNPVRIRIGASELNGHWGSPLGPALKQNKPDFVLAGYELFTLNREQLFDMLVDSRINVDDQIKSCDRLNNVKVESVPSLLTLNFPSVDSNILRILVIRSEGALNFTLGQKKLVKYRNEGFVVVDDKANTFTFEHADFTVFLASAYCDNQG